MPKIILEKVVSKIILLLYIPNINYIQGKEKALKH